MIETILIDIIFMIWAAWFYFNDDVFSNLLNMSSFYFDVFCAYICYFTFGTCCTITQTIDDEVVREMYIGH